MKPKFSPRLALLVIAGMFLLPLVLAWLMYSGTIEFQPSSTRNFGRLVEPPLPISWDQVTLAGPEGLAGPAIAFEEHWVVLQAIPADCPEVCEQALIGIRQVHRASGRHQPRIRLALLLPDRFPEDSTGWIVVAINTFIPKPN